MPSRRWLLLSILVVVLWFAAFGSAWSTIGGPYNAAVGHGAVALWRFFAVSDAAYTQATAEEIELTVYRPLPNGQLVRIPYVFSGYFQVSCVLVVALFIVTPKLAVGRKVVWCSLTLVALYAFHVVYLVSMLHIGIAREVLPQIGIPSRGVDEWLYRLLAIAKHLVPVLLWAGAALWMWRRSPRSDKVEPDAKRTH